MKRSTRWPRQVGAAIAASLLATTGLALGAGSAGAMPASGLDATVTSPPTSIGLGTFGQAGGTLRIAPTDTVAPIETFTRGDQIRVFLETPTGAGVNCATPTDFVRFASLPTVTNSGTATFTASLEESTGTCDVPVGTYNDVLLITVTGAGSGVFDVTGVKLDNGVDTTPGLIGHSVVLNPAGGGVSYVTGGPPNNGIAYISPLVVTANVPPMGAAWDGSGLLFQSGSPIVITEPTPAAADGLDICLTLGGGNTFDTLLPKPTVAVSGGDTASTVTVTGGDLEFTVTGAATAAVNTFTVSGFRTTRGSTGPDFVTLSTAGCPAGGPETLPVTISTVVDVTRFAGGTRYDTAALAAADWGCMEDSPVVLASGENFPDALSSSYLASNMGTLVLLTPQSSIANSTLNALRNGGFDSVLLIGGTGAISQGVEDQLRGTPNYLCDGVTVEVNGLGFPLNLSVTRISGTTRYDTMEAVVEWPGFTAAGTADYDGTPTDPDGSGSGGACLPLVTAVIATGENFPDALVAGEFAVGSDIGCGDAEEIPVILTPTAALGVNAASVLTNLGIQQVIIAGGTGAVSSAVETSIQAMGIATKRFAGATRLDTAVALSTFKGQFFGRHDDSILVVRGDNFADALAAPAWFGHNANMVLTESPTTLGAPTAAFLAFQDNLFPANMDPIDSASFFGGSGAISNAVFNSILAQVSIVESPS